jgi:Uncharacterized protein conserved in bacteria
MGYYDKNKEAIKTRYQDSYEEIFERMEKEVTSEYQVESIVARDGNHALTVEKNGDKFRLNSVYRPLEEAKKWADQYEFQNLDVNVFMFGFGNGIFVRELLHRTQSDARVYLWEPNVSIFRKVMEEEDLEEILKDKRLYLYIGEDGLKELKEAMECSVSWHNMPSQIRCAHVCYDRLHEEEYLEFLKAIKYSDSMVQVKRDTNVYFAHRAVVNVIDNLRYIRKSNFVTDLIGKLPEEIPAIVVAAGPSLEKNIDLLKKAQGRAFIIASDTAVRNLEAKGLPYDCVITIDPGKHAWYMTDFPGCKEKPLFCNSESQREIMKFHTGRKIWAAGSVYIDNLYSFLGLRFPESSTGGSVATAGTQLAFHLNLKNIILIGQDLAYTGEHTHAGGYDNHILNEEKFIEEVDGIDGGKVVTRGDWIVFRDWYEEFIKLHEDVNLVDATEGGALIHGSKIMTLEEALDTYCGEKEFSFEKIMEELPPTFDVLGFEPVRDVLQRMGKGFHNILERSKEGKKAAEEYLAAGSGLSPKKHDRLIKTIRKANNYLQKQAGYELMEMYTFDLTLNEVHDVNQMTGDVLTDERDSVEIALAIYNSYIDGVEELGDQMDQALQEI